MQQIMLVLILNIMILPSHFVLSENSTPVSETNSECGTRANDNLRDLTLRGAETTVSEWPWVASIYFKDPFANEQAKLYGTASIVTDRHLITIAKVVPSRGTNSSVIYPSDFFAVVGGEYEGDGILYDIKNIYKYFRTADPILGAGLAIVQVVNKMMFTDFIRPICLPSIHYLDIQQQNRSFTAVSWSNSTDNSSETPVLYEVNVQILSEDYCQQFIQGPYPTDKLICGKRSEETSYKYGNGGPLVTSINGKFTIAGVTDNDIGQGLPSESPDIPIYFLTAESYIHMNWITNIIHQSLE